jgi:PAS domain S-box-containing protein
MAALAGTTPEGTAGAERDPALAYLDVMPDGVLLMVGQAIRYANAAAERLFRARTPLVGRAYEQLLLADDVPLARARVTRFEASGQVPPPTVLRLMRDDGTPVEAEAHAGNATVGGEPGRMIILRDLTDRRQAERAVAVSEERLRLVAGTVNDLVSLRARSGEPLWASPSHERVLGYGAEELAGLGVARIVHAEDRAAWDEALARLRGPGRTVAVRLRWLAKDGRSLPMDLQLVPLPHDPDGRYVVAGRDLTGQVALEAEHRRVETLEALVRMATGAAHDVNNLLTAVQLAADALGPAQASTAHQIAGAVERAASIARGLLAFSRTAHRAPERITLLPWLEETVREVRGTGVVHLAAGAGAETVVVQADPIQLRTVVHALVRNAQEASGRDGVVTVRLARLEVMAGDARHPRLGAGGWAAVRIEDAGRGMSPAVLAHAVEPYFTTKPAGSVEGLGLSAAHGIVTQAGGVLEIESVEGDGTTVTVYWPLAAAGPHTGGDAAPTPAPGRVMAPATPPAPVASERARTVLVVDDDPLVRSAMARALAALGHVVCEAATATEAVAAVRAHDPALLVCDVRMPGMSGQELVAYLMAEGHDLPVLFVSGQLDAPLLAARVEGMPRRFLAKPFTAAGLAAAVRDLLA